MNTTSTRLQTLIFHIQNSTILSRTHARITTNAAVHSNPYLLSPFAAFRPSRSAICAVLRAAAAAAAPEWRGAGEAVHCLILKVGFASEVILATGLLKFYAKHGLLCSAQKMFEEMPLRDVVACNAMMAALSRSGRAGDARRLFDAMPAKSPVSWNAMASCYCRAGDVPSAWEIFDMNPVKNAVSWNTMIDGYCRAGRLGAARELFDSMRSMRDVITWNTMISGYLHRGESGSAVRMFHRMQMENVRANEVTMATVLAACSHLRDLTLGRQIHAYIRSHHMQIDAFLGNTLIDMYFKCGSADCALEVFDRMPARNLFCWNSVIAGLGMNGHGERAIRVFLGMGRMKPDGVTFVALLSACSHSGLVSEGKKYFSEMQEVYGVEPKIEHYGCMVDLLCKARLLQEAMRLIEVMPPSPNAKVWGSLLHACQIQKDLKLSERVTELILELDPGDGAKFGLCNVHASLDRWSDVELCRRNLIGKGVHKVPGCSSTVVPNEKCDS